MSITGLKLPIVDKLRNYICQGGELNHTNISLRFHIVQCEI